MEKTYFHTKINDQMYYGKHVMVDAKSCDVDILDISIVTEFIKELVKKIDMTAHGDVIIERFGEGDDIGISAVQLITTSSITLHTNDQHRDLYLDVFSCKTYKEEVILEMLEDYFAPTSININVLLRR